MTIGQKVTYGQEIKLVVNAYQNINHPNPDHLPAKLAHYNYAIIAAVFVYYFLHVMLMALIFYLWRSTFFVFFYFLHNDSFCYTNTKLLTAWSLANYIHSFFIELIRSTCFVNIFCWQAWNLLYYFSFHFQNSKIL